MRKLYEPKKAKMVIKQKTYYGDVISVEKHNIIVNKNNEATRGIMEPRVIDPRQSTKHRVTTSLRKNAFIFSRDEKITINRK